MKRCGFAVFFMLVFFAISCILSAPGFAQDKTVTLRFSNFFPPSHKNSILMDEWSKEVTKRTNGRVDVKYYPGATLTPAAQTYDSVVQGVIDVGETVLGYTMGKFPLTEVLDYPIGYATGHLSTGLANAYFNKFKPKEFDEVKVMYLHGQGPGLIHSRKPIAKLEDMKGMKLRSFGSNAELVKALGGVPVAMTMGEAYDAVSKGVADGFLSPYEALEGWKLGEVIKYTTEDYATAYGATFIVAMNKAKWASISPADQKIIEQINQEWIEKQIQIWNDIDISGKEYSLKRGNQAIKLSPEESARWVKAVEPLFTKYVSDMKAKGLPGDEVLKFARDYLASGGKTTTAAPAKAPTKAPTKAPAKK